MESPSSSGISPAKRLGFTAVILLGLWGVVELLAVLSFEPATGSSFTEARDLARSLAAQGTADEPERRPGDASTDSTAVATDSGKADPDTSAAALDAATADPETSGAATDAATADPDNLEPSERGEVAAAPGGGPTLEIPDVRAGREQAGLGMRDHAMSIHPYFGYVYTPPKPGDPPGRIAVNQDGFLDDQPSVRKRAPGTVLVGIFGGSVAGQLGTFFSDRLRSELATKVHEFAGREIEFIKLGMPGYHQPQQVQQLTYILSQGGEFDLVLNLDGFNEVAVPAALNEPFGANPLFPMNWAMVALDVPDLEVRRHIGAATYLHEHRREVAARFENSPRRLSVLGTLIWKLQDNRIAASRARHELALREFQAEEIPYFIRGPERWHQQPEGLVPACVRLWQRASLQMHAICEAAGIRYVHMLQPNQYLPGSKRLTREEREKAFDPTGPYKPVVEEGYPLMRDAAAELVAAGVEFHDLSLLYENVGETVYADNCCHYNRRGNDLLCAAIAEAIAEGRAIG